MSLNLLRLVNFTERKCNSHFYCVNISCTKIRVLCGCSHHHYTSLKMSDCSSLHRFKGHFSLSKVYKQSHIISQNYTSWWLEGGRMEKNDKWLFKKAVQDLNYYEFFDLRQAIKLLHQKNGANGF